MVDGGWRMLEIGCEMLDKRSLHHEVAKTAKEQPMGDDRWRIADVGWMAEE